MVSVGEVCNHLSFQTVRRPIEGIQRPQTCLVRCLLRPSEIGYVALSSPPGLIKCTHMLQANAFTVSALAILQVCRNTYDIHGAVRALSFSLLYSQD